MKATPFIRVMKDGETRKVDSTGTYMVFWKKQGGKWLTVWETFNVTSESEEISQSLQD